MKKIVVSAFGRFGDYLENSTALVATRLLVSQPIPGFRIHPTFFDCCIPEATEDRGCLLFETALSLGASAIVSLGMASEKIGICVETITENRIYCPKYCPHLENQKIDEAFPLGHQESLDVERWQLDDLACLCEQVGVPFMKPSTSAGGFCCNHLARQLRKKQLSFGQYGVIPFIFVHIPCSPECVSDPVAFSGGGKVLMSIDKVIEGIEILLNVAHFSP